MAFNSGNSRSSITEMSIETGAVRSLRATRISANDSQYTPSGDRYVYADYSTGRSEIVVRDLEGAGAIQLTSGNPVATRSLLETRTTPRISPDGRRVVFSQSGQIWVVPATGGEAAPITPAGERAIAPAWSPDGRWVGYQRGLPGKRELAKVDPSGQGSPITLSMHAGILGVSAFTRWSAAGQIVYTGRDGLRACSGDGASDRVLVAGTGNVAGDFDPRGNRFYAIALEANEWRLRTIDVASGRMLRSIVMQESPDAGIRAASVHPDGKRLAYTKAQNNNDILLLTGLPRPAAGWQKLFRHWIEP
jgi:Tol biopolymer transport system component